MSEMDIIEYTLLAHPLDLAKLGRKTHFGEINGRSVPVVTVPGRYSDLDIRLVSVHRDLNTVTNEGFIPGYGKHEFEGEHGPCTNLERHGVTINASRIQATCECGYVVLDKTQPGAVIHNDFDFIILDEAWTKAYIEIMEVRALCRHYN